MEPDDRALFARTLDPVAIRSITVTAADVSSWVEQYLRAWRTNDPADVGSLFSDDAEYYTEPFNPPWVGRDAIVEGWLRARDEPDTWTFRYEVLAVADELAFIQGRTHYAEGKDYSNLWVLRLDRDGRCTHFTEWWMPVSESQA